MNIDYDRYMAYVYHNMDTLDYVSIPGAHLRRGVDFEEVDISGPQLRLYDNKGGVYVIPINQIQYLYFKKFKKQDEGIIIGGKDRE